MKKCLLIGLVALSPLLGTRVCEAGYLVSLSTIAPDLNDLAVGQAVTFDVNLSGIGGPADNLDFLVATIKFDGNLLGTPTITPGGIVPDPTGFVSTASPGLADANYDDLFATSGSPISTNGVFFRFDVTAQQAGSGRVFIDFVNAMQGTDTVPVQSGPDLSFRIGSVPEPGSMLLFGTGLLGLIGACHRRGLTSRTRRSPSA